MSGQQYYGLDHNLTFIRDNSKPSYFISFEKLDEIRYDIVFYYSSKRILMKGKSLDSLGQRLDGTCLYYYENGSIQSEGVYKNGRKSGVWKRFNVDGSSKTDRVYSDLSMETIVFNSARFMPKPNVLNNDFEKYVRVQLSNNIDEFISLSPIAIQLVVDIKGIVTESLFDDRLSLENMRILNGIIKSIPSWEPGSTGTQKINVRVNYSIDFSKN
jgi:antitoxin component YwqK of YwqJK toxin-antitoxin module